jgi:hypothetical protein
VAAITTVQQHGHISGCHAGQVQPLARVSIRQRQADQDSGVCCGLHIVAALQRYVWYVWVWVCASSLCVPCRLVRSECGMPPAPLVDWPPLMSARTAWLTRSHITAHPLHNTWSLTLRHCARYHDQPPPILCASHMWGTCVINRWADARYGPNHELAVGLRQVGSTMAARNSHLPTASRAVACGIVKLWP